MNKNVKKLLDTAKAEVGYLEKKSNMHLDEKNKNAGMNNFTKYAKDLYPDLQGQPWCDMYVDWCFVMAFGKINAKKMIGGFSAYTPTSAEYYKKKGRWYTKAAAGDQIFFKNNIRINHTGLVLDTDNKYVYTVEGNTSAGSDVVPNGGAVCIKKYLLSDPRIAGYGRPDWSVVEDTKYTVGWNHDENGWWYAYAEDSFYKGTWKTINGHKYYFNSDGYAVTNWQNIGGKWYYFEPRKGHEYECALYVTDKDGAQMIGSF